MMVEKGLKSGEGREETLLPLTDLLCLNTGADCELTVNLEWFVCNQCNSSFLRQVSNHRLF
jgi:hypothetical protein